MTHTFSTNTFAPKRTPWFGGVIAILILVLIAYACMLFMPATAQSGQGAAVAGSVSIPSLPNSTVLVNGADSLVHVFHVPGGYTDSRYQQ